MYNDEMHYQSLKKAIKVALHQGKLDLELQKDIHERGRFDNTGRGTRKRVPMVGSFIHASNRDLDINIDYGEFSIGFTDEEFTLSDANYFRAAGGKEDGYGGGRPSNIRALIITQDHNQELKSHYYRMSVLLNSRVYVQFPNGNVNIYAQHSSMYQTSCAYTGDVSC